MLYAMNSSMRFNSHLFAMNPNQNGTANVIPDNSGFATSIAFDACQLLGFSVKLRDLPYESRTDLVQPRLYPRLFCLQWHLASCTRRS